MKLRTKPGPARRFRRRHKLLGAKALGDPVRHLGLDLPFLIVTSISLQAAAVISIELAVIHIGTVLAAILLCRFLPRWSRPLAYLGVSTTIMLFISVFLSRVFPVVTDTLGMYIYLMAVNGMTFTTAMSIEKKDRIYPVLVGALKGIVGFALAMFLTSLLREYFGSGSLWGVSVPHVIRIDRVLVPFFGFILVGFLLAGSRLVSKKLLAFAIDEDARSEGVLLEGRSD